MLSDIDIAYAATRKPISGIAGMPGIPEERLILYGKHKTKMGRVACG